MPKSILLAVFLMGATVLYAQDSLQVQPLPPANRDHPGTPGADKEDRQEVDSSNLPPVMQNHLSNDQKYEGWEKGKIYVELSSGQYLVHVTKENGTQTFHFDKAGNPILKEAPPSEPESKH